MKGESRAIFQLKIFARVIGQNVSRAPTRVSNHILFETNPSVFSRRAETPLRIGAGRLGRAFFVARPILLSPHSFSCIIIIK